MKTLESNKAMQFHVLPPYGLMNDPNGLIHYKGYFHVFFQWNSLAMDHSYKCWGHAISKDMVTYTYLEPALLPEEDYELNGCYSGSAIVFQDRLHLFYTGNVKHQDGSRSSYQCLATSDDGFTFTKHGPVLGHVDGYTGHVRDPKVFEFQENFYMLLGAQKNDETGDTILFSSKDLKNWKLMGSILDATLDLGYMWECPDLIQFKRNDVFIFSPQGVKKESMRFRNIFQSVYMMGKFDGYRFHQKNNEVKELDHGFEFYAPQTFNHPDGRIILIGWMGVMETDVENALPTRQHQWVHHLSLPRQVKINKCGRFVQLPIKEIHAYFKNIHQSITDSMNLRVNKSLYFEVTATEPIHEIEIKLNDEVTILCFKQHFSVIRTSWLNHQPETRETRLDRPLSTLSMFVDQSSIEIFINEGEHVFSLRFFTETLMLQLVMNASSKVHVQLKHFNP